MRHTLSSGGVLSPYQHRAGEMRAPWTRRNLTTLSTAARRCANSSSVLSITESAADSRSSPARTNCTDLFAHSHRPPPPAVSLIIGVHTSPTGHLQRAAIRATWMRTTSVGQTTVACFVVGRRLGNATIRRELGREAVLFGDILLLEGVAEHRKLSVGKALAFWRAAAHVLRRYTDSGQRAPFVAKSDDDAFVHVRSLEAALVKLHCMPFAYFGAFAFTGYHPLKRSNCGFSWLGSSAYERYNCSSHGAHPPFPFALGQLQVLSAGLVRALAAADDTTTFAAAAEAQVGFEDSALGYLISRLVRSHRARTRPGGNASTTQPALQITYVPLSSRHWHNLGCFARTGIYRHPSRESIIVHAVKTSGGMHYVERALNATTAPSDAVDLVRCLNALDQEMGPISRKLGWCRRCTTVGVERNGPAWAFCGFNAADRRGQQRSLALARESCTRHGLIAA